jgi:hypothetical protein
MPLNMNCRTNRPYMLWNYMTNTTTWAVLNALAGSTVNMDEQTLFLNPKTIANAETLEVPLFYPHFWLWLTYNRKERLAKVRVVKTFKNGLQFRKICKLTEHGKITDRPLKKPFVIAEAAELEVQI